MTSGSTGRPRGVDRGRTTAAQGIPLATLIRHLPLPRGRPMVVTSPLFHGFGLGFCALGLAFGLPVVLLRDPVAVARYVADRPGGVLTGVPPVLARVQRAAACSGSGRRGVVPGPVAVVSGGGLLHPTVATALLDRYGPVLFNLYGSSEDGWSTLATPGDLIRAPGTIGRPAVGVRVQILDENDRRVRVGTTGRICISSRLRFAGYTGGGGRLRIGGYADSGDRGHRDDTGLLFVDGRSDDLLVTGGENVYPAEVEEVLLAHPGVAEARLAGAADPEFGTRLIAFVVLLPGVTIDDVVAHTRTRLPRPKVPREFRVVPELGISAVGKALGPVPRDPDPLDGNR